MRQPYRPPVGGEPPKRYLEGLKVEATKHLAEKALQEWKLSQARMQAESDKLNEGTEWEILDTVLPLGGGKGFKCQFYKNGEPVDGP